MNFIYISDFFFGEKTNLEKSLINGGAEQNDFVLLQILQSRGHKVDKILSKQVTLQYLINNRNSKYIISNFVLLNKGCIEYLIENCSYIIYEHDHKYLTTRDPSYFEDFKAPKECVINELFYNGAKCVLTQSAMHKRIVELNLPLAKIISVGGNLWDIETLEYIESLNLHSKKEEVYSIMYSHIPHKNTEKSIQWCKATKKRYEIIPSLEHKDFLESLAKNKYLLFYPRTIETLSRIVVEAKMLGCSILTSREKVGATSEPWIALEGKELINVMRSKRVSIPEIIIETFNESIGP